MGLLCDHADVHLAMRSNELAKVTYTQSDLLEAAVVPFLEYLEFQIVVQICNEYVNDSVDMPLGRSMH